MEHEEEKTEEAISRIKAEESPLYTPAIIQKAVDLVHVQGVEAALMHAEEEYEKAWKAANQPGAHRSWRNFVDFWADVKYLITIAFDKD